MCDSIASAIIITALSAPIDTSSQSITIGFKLFNKINKVLLCLAPNMLFLDLIIIIHLLPGIVLIALCGRIGILRILVLTLAVAGIIIIRSYVLFPMVIVVLIEQVKPYSKKE